MKRIALFTCLGISAAAYVFSLSPLGAADPNAAAPAPQEGKGDKPFKHGGDRKFGGRHFQRPGGDRERGPGHGGGLDHMLNLTDEQKAKVKQIMDDAKPKIDAIREEERAKIKLIMDDAQSKIRPLLTPEQQQVMDNAKKVREDMDKLRESQRKLRQDDKKAE